MSPKSAWIVLVPLSDSFRSTVAQVAAEVGADLLEWSPAEGDVPAAGAAAVLVLAGGEEAAAVDLIEHEAGEE